MSTFKQINFVDLEGVKYAQNNFIYEVLSETDKDLIYEAAECLSDVFVGVHVGDAFISEPVINALQITKETFLEFTLEYLRNVANQGLTIIARDKESGEVVGVSLAESYDPEEVTPLFKGRFEPWNKAIELCDYLDRSYVKFLKSITGKNVEKNEHIHLFLLGIRLDKKKLYVATEMINVLARTGKSSGFKSIFAETTNYRAQCLADMTGFKVPLDEEGRPIVYTYADDPLFKSIPQHIGIDCKLHYRWLE